jgi:hypothetical protein
MPILYILVIGYIGSVAKDSNIELNVDICAYWVLGKPVCLYTFILYTITSVADACSFLDFKVLNKG